MQYSTTHVSCNAHLYLVYLVGDDLLSQDGNIVRFRLSKARGERPRGEGRRRKGGEGGTRGGGGGRGVVGGRWAGVGEQETVVSYQPYQYQ